MVGIGSPLKKKKPLGGAVGAGAIGGQLDGAGANVPDAPPPTSTGPATPPPMGAGPVGGPLSSGPGATTINDMDSNPINPGVDGSAHGGPLVGNAVDQPVDVADTQASGGTGAAPQSDLDAAIEAYIRSQIEGAGNVDTSEQEALIRELMGDQAGKSAVGNRASMGRAGFASSGALSAMQADAARAARQQAEQDIIGVRTDAQGRATDAANAAIGLDIGMRDAATRGQQASAAQQALEALLGGSGGATGAGGEGAGSSGGVDDPYGIAQGATEAVGGVDMDQMEAERAANKARGEAFAAATVVSTPPQGATLVYSDGSYDYYEGVDGAYYKVVSGDGSAWAANEVNGGAVTYNGGG